MSPAPAIHLYSIDGMACQDFPYAFRFDCLYQAMLTMQQHQRLQPGAVILQSRPTPFDPSQHLTQCLPLVLEFLDDQAFEKIGDGYLDQFSTVAPAAQAELLTLMQAWCERHIPKRTIQKDIRGHIVTEHDIALLQQQAA